MRAFIAVAATLIATSAGAVPLPTSIPAPSALCRSAILLAERATRVPDRLLNAIATVESGRRDPVSGAVYPWPWAINVEGAGHFYDSKADAIAAVRGYQAQGIRSIDVGCMQVNLMHHPDAFATLDQAFDPVANAAYAARFLTQLFAQTNAWPRAAAAYHSWTPELGADYARKVLAAWGVPQPPPAPMEAAAISALAQSAPAPLQSGTYAAPSGGRVAVMMPTGSDSIKIVTMANTGANAPAAPAAGGLDRYRAAPIMANSRFTQMLSPRGHATGF